MFGERFIFQEILNIYIYIFFFFLEMFAEILKTNPFKQRQKMIPPAKTDTAPKKNRRLEHDEDFLLEWSPL